MLHSQAVLKYEVVQESRPSVISLPVGAQILSCGIQGPGLFIWALVDRNTDSPKEDRFFSVQGTCWDLPKHWGFSKDGFIGTVQTHDGLVWHIFEVLKSE